MHHFFVKRDNIRDQEVRFDQTDYVHITKVLRLKADEKVSVSDGEFFYTVALVQLMNEVTGKIVASKPVDSESPLHTILVQGIAKGEKMDYIIQKATELGVSEIIPVETSFCVVKLDDRKRTERAERWQKIANEAAKQCKRGKVPKIHLPCSWRDVFSKLPNEALKLVLWESEENTLLNQVLKLHSQKKILVLFIGPEGGLAPEEVNFAMQNNALSVSLGKRILRTETAGMTVLAIAQYVLGDLGGA